MQFTMSMYANKEDLYKAKCDYYEKKLGEVEILLLGCTDAGEHNVRDNIIDILSVVEDTLYETY